MKRLALSLVVFSIWAILASTYYVCIIQGLCPSDTPLDTPTEILQTDKEHPTESFKISKVDSSDNNTSITNSENSPLQPETNSTLIDTLKSNSLKIVYENEVVINYNGNFRIYKNSNRIQIPLSISTYGHAIAEQMDTKNLALIVTGFYNENESENIGKERAHELANKLIKLGITDSLISINSKKAIFNFKNNKFKGGIHFQFRASKSPIDLKHIDYASREIPPIEKIDFPKATIFSELKTEQKIAVSKPITSNFPKKQNAIKDNVALETTESKSYTVTQLNFKNNIFKGSKGLKNFLLENTKLENIRLIGYSNASESTATNYETGIKLAQSVAAYITEKHFFEAKIEITALKSSNKGTTLGQGVTLITE